MRKINKILTCLFLLMLVVFSAACTKKYELSLNDADKSIQLTVGEDKTIVPIVTEGGLLEWSSSAATVASVNNGVIKALTPGTATITVKVSDTDVSANISVTVVAPLPSSVTISGDKAMKIGGNVQLSATIAPQYATGTIQWSSSDATVATVDQTGKVTSLKAGKVTITAKVVNTALTTEVKATHEITISLLDPTAITISGDATVDLGKDVQLTATVTPANAVQTVTWSSSDNTIATVDQTGKVSTLKAGEVTITATTSVSTIKQTHKITINEVKPTSVTITGDAELIEGRTTQLTATVAPANAKQNIVWTSSDATIATVSETGLVTALKVGEVTITATSTEATVKNTHKITIKSLGVTSVALFGQSELIVGEKSTYTTICVPVVAKQDIVWSVDKADIAEVSTDGVVTAKAAGTVVLTATAKDSTVKIEKTITVLTAPESNILVVAASLAGKTAGESIEVDGVKYLLGTTAFDTLEALAAKLENNNTVYVMAGEYTTMTLNKSGVKFIGKEAGAKIIGIIDVTATAKHTVFEKLTLTGKGQIKGAAEGTECLTVNNCTFDSSTVEASEGTLCFMGAAKDITVTNTNVINNKAARTIRIKTTCENLTVTNNLFEDAGGSYDYIRSDGALSGIVNICDNTFNKSSQSAIMVMAHGSGIFKFLGNQFYSMAATCIDIRTTLGVPSNSTMEIAYNIFDNQDKDVESTWGCIRLRYSDYTADTLKININHNCFKNWGNVFIDDATPAVDGVKPPKLVIANCDNNYFDTSEINAESFANIASSFDNIINKYSEFQRQLDVYKLKYAGENVLFVGTSSFITKEKFATLAAALAAAKAGDTIYLLPGTYDENVTISINNITIKSLNAGVDPNGKIVRTDEAIFKGCITLAKGLVGFKVDGIKFAGKAMIKTTKGDDGSASDLKTNLIGFTFINNIVESSLLTAEGKGFIYFVGEGKSCYNHNIVIKNNSFKNTEDATADSMIWLDNTYDLEFVANSFENVKGTALYVNDTTKGLSGQVNEFVSNKFKNVGNGIHLNWISPLPAASTTSTLDITNNKFDTVTGEAIYIGEMNNTGDIYARFNVSYNVFTSVGTGVNFARINANTNTKAFNNLFTNIPTSFYFVNQQKKTSAPIDVNCKNNLYMNEGQVITPAADKFSNADATKSAILYETTITSLEDLPVFVEYTETIFIDTTEFLVGEKTLLEVIYDSDVPFYNEIIWTSSDETILKIEGQYAIPLQSGKVTLTATYAADESIKDVLEVQVTENDIVEVRFEGNGNLNVNDTLQLTATTSSATTEIKYNWSSSDDTIATVDQTGKVTAVKAGNVTITCTLDGTEAVSTVALTVLSADMTDELLKLLVNANNGVVMYRLINYYGYEAGSEEVPHMIYGSANKYYAAANPTITENLIPSTNTNVDFNDKISKVELITVHDTGSASVGATASANSSWCTNTTNTGTSWHYTVGNDGIFHQLADDVIGWHAGDGSTQLTGTIDTGVKATTPGVRAKVTIDGGYYVVNGTKTTLLAPKGEEGATLTTEDIVDSGIVTIIGANGNYFINTYYNSTYKKIASFGGASSIGIETAVNRGSDVYLTWQRTAKFVASKLVQYNLTLDRVVQHNNLSGKNCPQTMRTADLWDEFMKMVEIEYLIQKNYSDYQISFTSSNPEVLDNAGRVVGNGPKYSTAVNYTITITKGTDVKSATVSVLVVGNRNSQL